MSETAKPVSFLPLPPEEGRQQAMHERRNYSRALADAAKQIKNLQDEAYVDTVTKLPNRAVFQKKLPELIEIARHNKIPLGLMMLDVDGLKRTNDGLGHPTGDAVLEKVGKAFEGLLRPDDIVGRLGGDEFFALLPGYSPMPGQTDEELNNDRAERLKAKFAEFVHELGIPDRLHVDITVGISVLNPEDTQETFVKRADDDLRLKKEANYSTLSDQGITFEDTRVNRST